MSRPAVITRQNCFLFGLLLLALIPRLYRLPSTYQFQGDQGRDALVLYSLLIERHPILLGPTTSVGNYYLGPFFYYFTAPSLLLSRLNPAGPAVFQAILGVISVGLMYLLARKLLSPGSSLIIGLLFALSPTLITYSRFAWNPNPTPFFAILFIWSLYNFFENRKTSWFVVSVIAVTLLWQLHYMLLVYGLALIGAARFWLRQKLPAKHYFLSVLVTIPFLTLALLPLLASWYKNTLINPSAGASLISVSFSVPLTFVLAYFEVFTSFLPNFFRPLTALTAAFMAAVTAWAIAEILIAAIKKTKIKSPQKTESLFWNSLVLVAIGFLVSLSLLDSSREIHYFLGYYPLMLLLFGKGLDQLFSRINLKQRAFLTGVLLLVFAGQLTGGLSTLFHPTGLPAATIRKITQDIQTQSQAKPFNFALIADWNERKAYEYFLTLNQAKHQNSAVTDQIFIVCENPPCNINGHPDWQIAQFESAHPNAVIYAEIDLPYIMAEYPKLFQGTVKIEAE